MSHPRRSEAELHVHQPLRPCVRPPVTPQTLTSLFCASAHVSRVRYTGRLCSECAAGSFRMFDGTCRACGVGTGALELFLGCCFFGWVWRALLTSSKPPCITVRLAIEWAQLVGALSLSAAPMPPFLRQHLAIMKIFNFSPYFLPWACSVPSPHAEEVVVTILYEVKA